MSKSNENFSTPVPQQRGCRRLGLRRSGSSITKSIVPSLLAKTTEAGTNTPNDVVITPLRQPYSDAKVNYRHLNNCNQSNGPNCLAASPETPNSSCLLRKESLSTNCRPYRLSLSKRVREKMTKKRLEFHLANEMEKDEGQKIDEPENKHRNDPSPPTTAPIETTQTSNSVAEYENMSEDELIAAIEEARKELQSRQLHVAKVQELEDAIKIWKIGFITAFASLQEKILPPIDKETLLEKLHIPKEILKHVTDLD